MRTPKQDAVTRGGLEVDPITFQVLHSGLLSAAREMGTTMLRTSYSVIFSEGYDFSCAILNRVGQMVATVNFCPVHLAAMPYAAAWSITELGVENLDDGDVIIHNDPYRGGTHISDVNVIKPIFFDGRLIAFAANRGHQLDMGGKSPGGFAGDATDIFQEGIRIPPVKWYERGEERRDVLDFILSNVRLPKVQLGDFKAQLASNITAERRIHVLCERYGVDTVLRVMDEIMDYSERRMRAEIREIPDGVYAFEDWLDNDGITADPIRLYVEAKIEDDSITIDYSGSSEQVAGPINATYGVAASSTFNALLSTLDPLIPVNHGAFRPVQIIAPRGSIMNANFPAPVQGGNTNTSIALVGLVIGALAKALPDRVIAASGGTCNDFTCGGLDPTRQQRFVFYWFPPTGWGALPVRDGWNVISDPVSNCSDTPVEIMENLYPFVYERYELGTDCEGPGRFRGGYGLTQEIRTLVDITTSAIAERHVVAPYGLFGGGASETNEFAVRRSGDSRWRSFAEDAGTISPSKFSDVALVAGDAWRMRTAAGGGYGDPLKREPEAVLVDVEDELVSRTRAADVYGVVLREEDDGRVAVDQVATERLRAGLASKRSVEVTPEGITLDPTRRALTETRERRGRGDDPAYSVVERALAGVPTPYCESECPLQADGHRCPWHNREMLEYWSVEALEQWTLRRCPANEQLLAGLRGASSR